MVQSIFAKISPKSNPLAIEILRHGQVFLSPAHNPWSRSLPYPALSILLRNIRSASDISLIEAYRASFRLLPLASAVTFADGPCMGQLLGEEVEARSAQTLGSQLNRACTSHGLSLLQLQTVTGINATNLVKLEHNIVP